LKGGKGRAVGSTGTAFDTFFEFFFDTLQGIVYWVRHGMKNLSFENTETRRHEEHLKSMINKSTPQTQPF
jgi:hypothetical protein